jgi:SAM-dependent methyltransferase
MARMRTTPPPRPGTADARYERKREHRGRGLADLERRVGSVCAEIDTRLAQQDVVRVLELGCGFGMALLDLVARYGQHVEAVGITRLFADADGDVQRREATRRGVAGGARLPAIAVADVSRGLPFADDAFDLVVSQVAWQYFANKAGVLREAARILAPSGIALIDADEAERKLPGEYARLFEIWRDGRLVTFGDYLAQAGASFVQAPDGTYVRAGKRASLGAHLTPLFEIDLAQIHAGWDGVKCVYAYRPPSADATTPSATSASIAPSS